MGYFSEQMIEAYEDLDPGSFTYEEERSDLDRQYGKISQTPAPAMKENEMSAYISVTGFRVHAAPEGEYGFGTLGFANPEDTLKRAWRMVQRAGLAKVANRTTADLCTSNIHTSSWVEYELVPEADLSRVPARSRKD